MSCTDFLTESITKTKLVITAYEDAILALAGAGAIESYTLDTGQSRQTVTRADVSSINRIINSLMNRCATLQARLNGSGSGIGRPGW